MLKDLGPRGKIVFFGLIVFIVLGLLSIIVYFIFREDSSDYGPEVSIVNFDEKVENLPDERERAISASIYNTVRLNIDIDESDIGDVFIRDDSESQEYESTINLYSGSFIVDIPEIEQSYQVTYFYSDSSNASPNTTGGYSIAVTCLPEEQLIYGAFNCIDMLSEEASDTDPIIQYLPYTSISFSIRPDSTSGELLLRVELRIPQIDLSGSDTSKRQTVSLYKNEVISWIREKGLEPADYTIIYNYSDDGKLLD